MSWESCIVLLNSDSTETFYCGDIVTGSVVLEFKKEQKVENITFKVFGISKAQWSRSKPTIPYIQIYSEKNTILDYDIDVFQDINGTKVKPGIRTFHFHFLLPGDAPSTFKSLFAEVSYFIQVNGKARCKCKCMKVVPFKVHGNVNLNHLEEYLEPTFIEAEKRFIGSKSFTLCFKTYIGFGPRQIIPFEAIFTNLNKVMISKMNASLVQKLQYNISAGYAKEEKTVCKIEHRQFSQTVTERCHFEMEVPQIVPSSVHLLNPMIDISYVLRVEVIFRFHRTLCKDIPVTVTTIPVMHNDFQNIEYKM